MNRRGFIATALAFFAGAALGRIRQPMDEVSDRFGPPQGRDGFGCTMRTYWNLQTIRPDQLRLSGL